MEKNLEKEKEVEKLNTLVNSLPEESKVLGQSLINKAVFLLEQMAKLEEIISADGPITVMSQGLYSIQREHPALRSYSTCLKNYQNIIKQVTALSGKTQTADTDWEDFD